MVVDAVSDHPYKAEILLLTLEKFGAVPRDRIVVQCTERVSQEVRNRFVGNGYRVHRIPRYLDGRHCNKIRQLDWFVETEQGDADGVFLLDIDMAVLAPLDVLDRSVIWGKIVDGPNPPLEVLERIFTKADIEIPAVVPCDWGNHDTIATNFNGGFYYVPMTLVPALRAGWRRWAEFLFIRPDLFAIPDQRIHTDQVAFAMAVASDRLPYRHLVANHNFPCHSERVPKTFRPDETVQVLHYHQCLDEFGLIAPEFSDPDFINEAVDRANDAISDCDGSMFFEMYKRHLAKEAVSAVPIFEEPLFSERFLVRTRIGGRKRRLVLHAGTPKTGTSSLQLHLGSNRELLAGQGFWYPPPSDTRMPKHQQLVEILNKADETAFTDYIEAALRDMPDDAHTIIFTTEGIFNHWWDYPPKAKALLRQLAGLFDFELWVWFREPVPFAAALYAQYVRNPRNQGATTNVYGRDISFRDAMTDGWFRRHLDYLGFYYEAGELFGRRRVRPFLHEGDTVAAFLASLGIDALPRQHQVQNVSMRVPGIEIMRNVNRYALPSREQERVGDLVREIDGIIGDRAARFCLDEDEKKLVSRYAGQGWSALRRAASKRGALKWDAGDERSRIPQETDVSAIRHALVGPAELWRTKREFQIAFLKQFGLEPHHTLLDLGCGTLRGGIPLIEYLQENHYVGFEVRREVLEEGRIKLQEAGLTHKNPMLLSRDDISSLQLGRQFDFVWAYSVLIHLSDEVLDDFLVILREHLKSSGAFFANIMIGNAETRPPRLERERHPIVVRGRYRVGSCEVFPLVRRSLDFYCAAAVRNGLQLTDLGTIESLGFNSGNKQHDQHQVVRLTRA